MAENNQGTDITILDYPCRCHDGLVRNCPKLQDVMKDRNFQLGLNTVPCNCKDATEHCHAVLTNYRFGTHPKTPIVLVLELIPGTATVKDTEILNDIFKLIGLGVLQPFDDSPVDEKTTLEEQ